MTEEEWTNSRDLNGMLGFTQIGDSKRKLRLFSIACVRQFAPWVTDARLWNVMVACERYADSEINQSEIGPWRALALRSISEAHATLKEEIGLSKKATHEKFLILATCCQMGMTGTEPSAKIALRSLDDFNSKFPNYFVVKLCDVQPRLLRDIFGNPFRPIAFDPNWRTATAVGIAQTMYDSRHFNAMPILADALQDAGCEDAALLDHCRDANGVHVRGCWVVDLVLGKS